MSHLRGHGGLCHWNELPFTVEVRDWREGPLPDTRWIRPTRVQFTRIVDSVAVDKTWDLIAAHNAVAVVVYHEDLDAFICVRQFRPAVYRAAKEALGDRATAMHGVTLELVAGLTDKAGADDATVASEEVLEEAGFRVEPSRLRLIGTPVAGVSKVGTRLSVFFTTVSARDAVPGAGGGVVADHEFVQPVIVPRSEVPSLALDSRTPKPEGVLWGLQWACAEIERQRTRSRLTAAFALAAVAGVSAAVAAAFRSPR